MSSVNHSMLPFIASGAVDFRFRDYFQLVVHTCAWRSYIMSSAHIIGPKSQHGVDDTGAAWQNGSMRVISDRCEARSQGMSIVKGMWKYASYMKNWGVALRFQHGQSVLMSDWWL